MQKMAQSEIRALYVSQNNNILASLLSHSTSSPNTRSVNSDSGEEISGTLRQKPLEDEMKAANVTGSSCLDNNFNVKPQSRAVSEIAVSTKSNSGQFRASPVDSTSTPSPCSGNAFDKLKHSTASTGKWTTSKTTTLTTTSTRRAILTEPGSDGCFVLEEPREGGESATASFSPGAGEPHFSSRPVLIGSFSPGGPASIEPFTSHAGPSLGKTPSLSASDLEKIGLITRVHQYVPPRRSVSQNDAVPSSSSSSTFNVQEISGQGSSTSALIFKPRNSRPTIQQLLQSPGNIVQDLKTSPTAGSGISEVVDMEVDDVSTPNVRSRSGSVSDLAPRDRRFSLGNDDLKNSMLFRSLTAGRNFSSNGLSSSFRGTQSEKNSPTIQIEEHHSAKDQSNGNAEHKKRNNLETNGFRSFANYSNVEGAVATLSVNSEGQAYLVFKTSDNSSQINTSKRQQSVTNPGTDNSTLFRKPEAVPTDRSQMKPQQFQTVRTSGLATTSSNASLKTTEKNHFLSPTVSSCSKQNEKPVYVSTTLPSTLKPNDNNLYLSHSPSTTSKTIIAEPIQLSVQQSSAVIVGKQSPMIVAKPQLTRIFLSDRPRREQDPHCSPPSGGGSNPGSKPTSSKNNVLSPTVACVAGGVQFSFTLDGSSCFQRQADFQGSEAGVNTSINSAMSFSKNRNTDNKSAEIQDVEMMDDDDSSNSNTSYRSMVVEQNGGGGTGGGSSRVVVGGSRVVVVEHADLKTELNTFPRSTARKALLQESHTPHHQRMWHQKQQQHQQREQHLHQKQQQQKQMHNNQLQHHITHKPTPAIGTGRQQPQNMAQQQQQQLQQMQNERVMKRKPIGRDKPYKSAQLIPAPGAFSRLSPTSKSPPPPPPSISPASVSMEDEEASQTPPPPPHSSSSTLKTTTTIASIIKPTSPQTLSAATPSVFLQRRDESTSNPNSNANSNPNTSTSQKSVGKLTISHFSPKATSLDKAAAPSTSVSANNTRDMDLPSSSLQQEQQKQQQQQPLSPATSEASSSASTSTTVESLGVDTGRRLRVRNQRRFLPETTRHKRQALQDMTRPLKQWLCRHKDNPYPSKGEKSELAQNSKMTLVQVSNWFANARRRLKNTVKGDDITWARRIKMYNQFVEGNAELLNLDSSDDEEMWEMDEQNGNGPVTTPQTSQTQEQELQSQQLQQQQRNSQQQIVSSLQQQQRQSQALLQKPHIQESLNHDHHYQQQPHPQQHQQQDNQPSSADHSRSQSTTPSPAPTLTSSLSDVAVTSPGNTPSMITSPVGTSRNSPALEENPGGYQKYKHSILQRYLQDASHQALMADEEIVTSRTRHRHLSSSTGSHDFEYLSTSSVSSPSHEQHHDSFDDFSEEFESIALRRKNTEQPANSNATEGEDMYWKEIGAAIALTSLARTHHVTK